LKIYIQYCSDATSAQIILEENLAKNVKLSTVIERISSLPRCKNQPLQSWLIRPLQRVTKYPLLLRELLKHSDESHPDYQNLLATSDALNTLLDELNFKKKEAENLTNLRLIQKKFSNDEKLRISSPTRKFIAQGKFRKVKKGKNIIKPCYVLLFNDSILLASKKVGGLVSKSEILPVSGLMIFPAKEEEIFAFCLVWKDTELERVTIFTISEEEQAEWEAKITETINLCEAELLRKGSKAVTLFKRSFQGEENVN